MYNSVFISILFVAALRGYAGAEQVQMPDEHPEQTENLENQIKDLQTNISDLWSYIYGLRTVVGNHLTHLRQHQVALERFHDEQHFSNDHFHSHSKSDDHHGDDHHGDDHHGTDDHHGSGHHGTDDHHGSGHHGSNDHHGTDDHHGSNDHHGDDHHGSDTHGDDHHGDDHGSSHSQSQDSHGHGHSDHSHSSEQHSHGDDSSHHSHGGDDHHSHSHSGEHSEITHDHSKEHTDNDHTQSRDHSQEHGSSHSQGHGEGHQHDHKDSHEKEDLQQKQEPEPAMEPMVLPTKKPRHHHHHHGNHHSQTVETQQPTKDPLRLFPIIMDHHHHHEITSGQRSNLTTAPKYSEYSMYQFATCNVNPNKAIPENQQQEVKGQVSFWQKKIGGPVGIHVRLQGFSVGQHGNHHDDLQQHMSEAPAHEGGHRHGFHVHTYGDLSNGCQSVGPHYNPKTVNHGGPNELERHVGDLGNIECDENGVTNILFSDDVISLSGQYSIVGKSLAIHANADDYGKKPNDQESLKTGNSGTRIACCVIEHIEKLPIRSHKALKTATQHQNR